MKGRLRVMPRRFRRGEVVRLPEPVRPVPEVSRADNLLGIAFSRATDEELAELERAIDSVLGGGEKDDE